MTSERSINGAPHSAGYNRVAEDLLVLTAGLGTGAGLMYLCDPNRGRARRDQLIAEVGHLIRRDEGIVTKRAKDILHRARGIASEAAGMMGKPEPVPDDVLVERVRSRMGHLVSHPLEVEVHARNGVVRLEGTLRRAERRRFRDEVRKVPGVKHVEDHLKSASLLGPGLMMGLAAGLALLRRAHAPRTHALAGRIH